jgi:pimeloyl-[acyl-carrier protein] methyl ester esterase
VTDTLHSETTGTGEPVVLLHGWAMNLRVFDSLVAALSRDCRITAFDLPGHGRSPWRTGLTETASAERLLEELPERCTLIGWSLGGQLALRVAASAPARIKRLVLIGSTPKFLASENWPHGLDRTVLLRFATGLQKDAERTVLDFLELQVRGSAAASSTLTHLRRALSLHGFATAAALEAGLRQLESADLRDLAGTVRTPTLLVSGQYDRITPPGAARALQELLPDARLLELRRAGHAPFLSHLDALTPELLRFLSGPDAGGAAP